MKYRTNIFMKIKMAFICVSSIFISISDYVSSQILCEGRGNCCAGFMYDVNSSSCIACRTGFIGKNCEKACPYPMYGDGCQQRCSCERSDCNITIGCIHQTTVENGSRVSNTTDSTTFTSGTILSTPVGYDKTSLYWSSKESNRTLQQETVRKNNLTAYAELPQTSTKMITSTKLNRPEVIVVNGQTPLLVGIFSFNALFVLVIIVVLSYCVCRRYKNYRKRKKDNSATVIHYHEIDENAVGPSREYDPLYTTQVSEIPKDFLVDYENEPFNRERQSCQISDSDLQHRSSYTTPKCLIHEDELPSTRKSTEDKQEADFTDDGQIYLTCQN